MEWQIFSQLMVSAEIKCKLKATKKKINLFDKNIIKRAAKPASNIQTHKQTKKTNSTHHQDEIESLIHFVFGQVKLLE
jgi:hypothetical protein